MLCVIQLEERSKSIQNYSLTQRYASSVKTMVYISFLANHPFKKLFTGFIILHLNHLVGFIILYALTDSGIQAFPVDKGILFRDRDKAITAVGP